MAIFIFVCNDRFSDYQSLVRVAETILIHQSLVRVAGTFFIVMKVENVIEFRYHERFWKNVKKPNVISAHFYP